MRPRLSKISAPYTELWGATIDADTTAKTYAATYDGTADDDSVELAVEFGGPLAGKAPLTVCIDDVELNDPQFEAPIPQARAASAVRANQVGYLPGFAKIATVATKSAAPVEWQLVDKGGKVRASGKTRPFGDDKSSGETVQQIDFSSFTPPGKGYRLKVGKDESLPFEIGNDVYKRLKHDALAFFYLQRSGVPITMPYAGSKTYERPAGHVGDKSVPCSKEAKCDYSLDVSGGWYDAGDHGKYLVNGGYTVWALQNEYEMLTKFGTTAGDFGDGKLSIPEGKNGKPDLLDEARFGLEALLKMQVPRGQADGGHGPPEDARREVVGDPDHARQGRHQALPAPGQHGGDAEPGGGGRAGGAPVEDAGPGIFGALPDRRRDRVRGGAEEPEDRAPNRRSRAAASTATATPPTSSTGPPTELFITTGKQNYKDDLLKSRFHAPKAGVETAAGELGWDHLAPAAKMSLVAAPNGLGDRRDRRPAHADHRRRRPLRRHSSPSAATACRWRPT